MSKDNYNYNQQPQHLQPLQKANDDLNNDDLNLNQDKATETDTRPWTMTLKSRETVDRMWKHTEADQTATEGHKRDDECGEILDQDSNNSQQTVTVTSTKTIDYNRAKPQQQPQQKRRSFPKVFPNRKIFKYFRKDEDEKSETTGKPSSIKRKLLITKKYNNCNINLVKCNNNLINRTLTTRTTATAATAPRPPQSSTTISTSSPTTNPTQRKGKILRKVFDLSKYRYVKPK